MACATSFLVHSLFLKFEHFNEDFNAAYATSAKSSVIHSYAIASMRPAPLLKTNRSWLAPTNLSMRHTPLLTLKRISLKSRPTSTWRSPLQTSHIDLYRLNRFLVKDSSINKRDQDDGLTSKVFKELTTKFRKSNYMLIN